MNDIAASIAGKPKSERPESVELMSHGFADRKSERTAADKMKFALCVLTLNARESWPAFSSALTGQSLQPNEVIIVDSESTDGTAELAERNEYRVIRIPRKSFDHGATRQLAANAAGDVDVLVYMTQDAILAEPDSLRKLLRHFDCPGISAAFGRQLPHRGSGPIETFARLFNYPEHSDVRNLDSIPRLGFKTIFFSNSFGAYRKRVFDSVGGFPVKAEFGEDTQTVAKILLAGGQVMYAADATVYHSHAISFLGEFKRYKEIGIMHAAEPWLQKRFGATSGEGRRFVQMELSYLSKNAPYLIPSALIRTALKYCGYKLGTRKSQFRALERES